MFLHCFNAKKIKNKNALGEVIYFKVSPQASVTQTWNQSATIWQQPVAKEKCARELLLCPGVTEGLAFTWQLAALHALFCPAYVDANMSFHTN